MMELTGSGHFGGVFPFFIIYGAGLLSVAVLIYTLWVVLRWSRTGRDADLAVAGESVLKRGSAVIRGRVAQGDGPAVRLRIINQRFAGKADADGNVAHRWVEVEREIKVRPFGIVLSSGERVEVHPDEGVLFIDALEDVEGSRVTTRIQTAELSPGEQVVCVGDLEQRPAGGDGYRGTRMHWVMGPPRGGRMTLSAEPLGARYRRRVRHGVKAIGVGLFLLIGSHAISADYHLRVWRGHTELGSEARVRRWTTSDDDGDLHYHTNVTVRLPGGGSFAQGISRLSFASAGEFQHRLVPVRVVSGYPWATALGRTPTAHFLVIGLHAVLPFVIALVPFFLVKTEWFERGRASRRVV